MKTILLTQNKSRGGVSVCRYPKSNCGFMLYLKGFQRAFKLLTMLVLCVLLFLDNPNNKKPPTISSICRRLCCRRVCAEIVPCYFVTSVSTPPIISV